MFMCGAIMLAMQKTAGPEMTAGGWVFLVVAWAAILWATIYSFEKILRKK